MRKPMPSGTSSVSNLTGATRCRSVARSSTPFRMPTRDRTERVLPTLDLSLKLSRKEEAERLERAQLELLHLRLVLGGLIGGGGAGGPRCARRGGAGALGAGGA